jgi:hypothetical protein
MSGKDAGLMRISIPRKRFTDPHVFTHPWKISMPLYRRQEKSRSFWRSSAWSCGGVDVRLVAQEAAEPVRRY